MGYITSVAVESLGTGHTTNSEIDTPRLTTCTTIAVGSCAAGHAAGAETALI